MSLIGGGAIAFACRSPTQITVQLSTDVDCATAAANGTSLYGQDVASGAIATTRTCDPSRAPHGLGTLVLAPTGDKDGKLSILAVTGVRRPSEDCAASNYKGCIVARRRMRFEPHEPLTLPIEMLTACLDVACSEEETCFRGACIDAEVTAKDGCLGPDCAPRSATGGTLDDGTAPSDVGAVGDGANITDATVDAVPTDAGLVISLLWPTPGATLRGLALDGARLVWTEQGSPSAVQELDLVGGASVRTSVAGVVFGVARGAGRIVVAGLIDGGCGFELLNDGGTGRTWVCSGATATGVAADWKSDRYWFVTPNGAYLRTPDGGSGPVSSGPGYAEGDDAGAAYVTDAGIIALPWGTPGVAPIPRPIGRPGRGFAMSSQHWFVASTDGEIWAYRRSSTLARSITVPGAFDNVEDIVYDEANRTFYLTATRGSDTGIFRISGLDPATLP